MQKNHLVLGSGLVITILLILYFLGIIPFAASRMHPSGNAAYIPAISDSFEYYIEQNKQRIRSALSEHYYAKSSKPFSAAYALEDVVEMRAPFQYLPDESTCDATNNGAGKGFLLVHGLSDSPYLLSAIARSLAASYPCSLIRGLLSPGHGTVPGDLLKVRREDWEQATKYGIDSFRVAPGVDQLFVVAYSNGSALILDYLDRHRDDDFISGVVLLSPGLRANNALTPLTPYLRYFLRWVNTEADLDAVKYESFTTNAAAEFYLLTQRVTRPEFAPLKTPVFMAMSGDDTTVDNLSAVEFFCSKLDGSSKRLLWYYTQASILAAGSQCDGVKSVDVSQIDPRVVSFSHVGITLPATDLHYGKDGNYAACLAYFDDAELFSQCTNRHEETVYGENSTRDESGFNQGRLVRRLTFNPLYDELMIEIGCFIDTGCI